uniref:Uncharacterized protein n=1 Tax=Triticum urartu TaxID=4572 RepID=A0A8R7VAQ6_TRIUA
MLSHHRHRRLLLSEFWHGVGIDGLHICLYLLSEFWHGVGVDELKKGLEYGSVHVLDLHSLRALLLHVSKELGHTNRGPCGEDELVRSKRLTRHEKCDVRSSLALKELSKLQVQVRGWEMHFFQGDRCYIW